MFDQDVEVVRCFRFQIRVAQRRGILLAARTAVGGERYGLRDVLWIRARESASIHKAQVRARCEGVPQRNTGQDLYVGAAGFVRKTTRSLVKGDRIQLRAFK